MGSRECLILAHAVSSHPTLAYHCTPRLTPPNPPYHFTLRLIPPHPIISYGDLISISSPPSPHTTLPHHARPHPILSRLGPPNYVSRSTPEGFAVGFAVILPRQTEQSRWFEFLGNAPIWSPFWGLLGQFDTSSLEESVGDEWPTAITAPV